MYQPIIILGAPRSGTNMLRDMLVKLPGVKTWPCDEINYIWRHGNIHFPSDEFTSQMATADVCAYIKSQFDKFASTTNAEIIIEKTCANSLRVDFVNTVIPNAKYIFIVRNGLDVVASAAKRWKASIDIPYLLKKAKYVPLSDLPYYSLRYLLNHLNRIISKEKQLQFWGPSLNHMDKLLATHSLEEVCALQWQRCVDSTERDIAHISPDRIIRVSYEAFVSNPVSEFDRIASFIGKEAPESLKYFLQNNVYSGSVGKGRSDINDAKVGKLRTLIKDTMCRYGYE